MHLDEKIASADLDVGSYPAKWRKAKTLANTHQRENSLTIPYWDRVRLLYLELGGGYKRKS